MRTMVLIAVGAALGANLRYLVGVWLAQLWGSAFPYGTLLINVSGSFLLGLLYALAAGAGQAPALSLRLFLGVGLLGGYTTFSTFSYETYQLLAREQLVSGMLNAFGSVIGGLLATLAGIALGSLLRGS